MRKIYFVLFLIILTISITNSEDIDKRNLDILRYLGKPVDFPSSFDVNKLLENMKKYFYSSFDKTNYKIIEINIDNSEFPPIIYGKIKGKLNHSDLEKILIHDSENNFEYSGSTISDPDENEITYFAVNIISKQNEYFNRDANVRLRFRTEILLEKLLGKFK